MTSDLRARTFPLRLCAVVAAALLGASAPAVLTKSALAQSDLVQTHLAQSEGQTEDPADPSEMAREGLERIMRALGLLIEQIPQYEMPELMENGDIIIRRKQPDPGTEEEEDEEPDLKQTSA